MTIFRALLRKEVLEIRRTWRLWMLVIPAVVFAVSGPPTARYTAEIVEAIAGDSMAMMPITEPTWSDSYLQWTKNLQQIFPIILLVIASGSIAGEFASGTAIMVLSRLRSRDSWVVARFVAQAASALVVYGLATVLTGALTRIWFPDAPAGPLAKCFVVFAFLTVMLIAIGLAVSAYMKESLGAIGVTIAIFLGMAMFTMWPAANAWSPVGLLPAANDMVRGDVALPVAPIVTGLVVTAIALGVAIWQVRRREA